VRRSAPTLGQHNERILGGALGLSPADLHALETGDGIRTRRSGL
jgi:hypothetical protein